MSFGDFIKTIITTLVVFGIIALFIFIGIEEGSSGKIESAPMNEWISPDGVHYWFHEGMYGESFLAPRYDKNGNLVTD